MKVLIPDHSLQPLRSAIKLEIGYCISHLDISFKKGASFGKLNFFLTFVFLRFLKAEEVQHITFIPSDSHSGFYFPPSAVQMVPLSLQRGKRFACFSLAKLWHSCCH